MTSYRYRYLRRAGTSALALGAGLAIMAPAHAGASVHPSIAGHPSASQVTAARHAAATSAVAHRLSGFFAHADRSAARVHAAGTPTTAKLVGTTVPVYYLNPAFVAGHAAATPVARRVFMATAAVASNGGRASVWTVRDPHHAGAWKEVNIASGSDETDYAAKAGSDATAFEEPQIHAWYALRGDQVVPLNADARRSVGAHGVSVTQYRRIVHRRYAGTMPGSAYARRHELGGFDPHPAARTDRASAADTGQGSTALPAGVAGAAVLLACAGGAVALRRRTRRAERS